MGKSINLKCKYFFLAISNHFPTISKISSYIVYLLGLTEKNVLHDILILNMQRN